MDADNEPEASEPAPAPERPRGSDGPLLFAPLDWLRPAALLAIAATLVGRALAPSLRGIVVGLDVWVDRVESVGGLLSHLLLLVMVGMLMAVTLTVLRLPRLPLTYRLVATGLAGIVLGLSAPSSSARLSPEFSASLSMAAIATATLGTTQALAAPHTRALGVLLGLTSMAALARQTAWLLALFGGERALLKIALAGRAMATGALVLHALAVTLALLWVATRKRRFAAAWTTISMFAALFVARLAERVDGGGLVTWKAAIGRSALRLLSPPLPFVPLGVRVFLVTLALLLAVAALMSRRDAPAVVGTFALVLVAGVDSDIPLCALSIAVAALAAALTAHDPRSAFWSRANGA